MNLETRRIQCPYCGEVISVSVDTSGGSDSYWEDCQVCCRPMVLAVTVDLAAPNDIQIDVHGEDD